MLDGKTDDEMEAKALMNANALVDIYSGSWGPKDDGEMVDGPGVLAQMAFEIGATKVIAATNVMQSTNRLTEINNERVRHAIRLQTTCMCMMSANRVLRGGKSTSNEKRRHV